MKLIEKKFDKSLAFLEKWILCSRIFMHMTCFWMTYTTANDSMWVKIDFRFVIFMLKIESSFVWILIFHVGFFFSYFIVSITITMSSSMLSIHFQMNFVSIFLYMFCYIIAHFSSLFGCYCDCLLEARYVVKKKMILITLSWFLRSYCWIASVSHARKKKRINIDALTFHINLFHPHLMQPHSIERQRLFVCRFPFAIRSCTIHGMFFPLCILLYCIVLSAFVLTFCQCISNLSILTKKKSHEEKENLYKKLYNQEYHKNPKRTSFKKKETAIFLDDFRSMAGTEMFW